MLQRLIRYLEGAEHRVLVLFAGCLASGIGTYQLFKHQSHLAAWGLLAVAVVAWLVLLTFCLTYRSLPQDGANPGRVT